MARELILIPKLKYERLLKDVNKDHKPDVSKEEINMNDNQSISIEKQFNDDKQSSRKEKYVDKQPFSRMKPEQFLTSKKRAKTVKQKWMTFHM